MIFGFLVNVLLVWFILFKYIYLIGYMMFWIMMIFVGIIV